MRKNRSLCLSVPVLRGIHFICSHYVCISTHFKYVEMEENGKLVKRMQKEYRAKRRVSERLKVCVCVRKKTKRKRKRNGNNWRKKLWYASFLFFFFNKSFFTNSASRWRWRRQWENVSSLRQNERLSFTFKHFAVGLFIAMQRARGETWKRKSYRWKAVKGNGSIEWMRAWIKECMITRQTYITFVDDSRRYVIYRWARAKSTGCMRSNEKMHILRKTENAKMKKRRWEWQTTWVYIRVIAFFVPIIGELLLLLLCSVFNHVWILAYKFFLMLF